MDKLRRYNLKNVKYLPRFFGLFLFVLISLFLFSLYPSAKGNELIVRVQPEYVPVGEETDFRVGVFDSFGEPVDEARVFLGDRPVAKTEESGLTPEDTDWGSFRTTGISKITAEKKIQKGIHTWWSSRNHPKRESFWQDPFPKLPRPVPLPGWLFSRTGEIRLAGRIYFTPAPDLSVPLPGRE